MLQTLIKTLNIRFASYKCNYLGSLDYIILDILQIYNPRISEILKARWINFYPSSMLILDGLKGSNPIIITDRQILSQIAVLPHLHQDYIFYPIKYQSLYKRFKRLYGHLIPTPAKRKTQPITHIYRYKKASLIQNSEHLKNVLHHKSKKSQNYYK